MAQQMTLEQRYAPDDGIGEIHHQINISFDRDINRIQPFRAFESYSVLRINEEVNLMDMEWVHLMRVVRNSPVTKCPDAYGCHGWIRRCVFSTVDVETFLVLGEKITTKFGGYSLSA
jgi:hypothetical protein